MSHQSRFSMLLILTLISFPLLSEEMGTLPVYPGRTLYFEPYLETGFLFPLGDGPEERGNRFKFSMDMANLPENVNWGVSAVYSDGSYSRFGLGIHGGYSYAPANVIGINPYGGAQLLFSPQEWGSPLFSLILGTKLDVHLFKNNQVLFDTSLELPFRRGIQPSLSLSFGIRRSVPIKVPVPPVEMEILSLEPERFSPDNDGDKDVMFIDLHVKGSRAVDHWSFAVYDSSGKRIFQREEKGAPPEFIEWDGDLANGDRLVSAADYRAELILTDILGNSVSEQRDFLSDILVIYENNQYRILIPSIVFPVNSADFSLLEDDDVESNREIIERLAAKLMKFPEYQIRIEGHGNIDNWHSEEMAEKEQLEVLIPLTEERARAIKEALVEQGLREDRFSIKGHGGAFPLVPFEDGENRWKNRRVEFILLK